MRVSLLLLSGLLCSGGLTAAESELTGAENTQVRRTAVIGKAANLAKDGNGWQGILREDGEGIVVDGRTQVLFLDGATERVEAGARIGYEGRRDSDGLMVAEKLEVSTNPVAKNEAKLWHSLTPRIKASGANSGLAGEMEISGVGRYSLAADAEAQSYVQRVGEAVIPAYLKELPAGSKRRIEFQFYLVQGDEFGAFSLANGTVIVHSKVLQVLGNEAQLAAVLAHEIAHVVQQHQYRQQQQSGEAAGLAAVKMGYPAEMENQADRNALGYLAAAGYDPREAAAVWVRAGKLKANEQSANFWGNPRNVLARQSYVGGELANYSTLSLISYSLGGGDFARIAARLGDREAPRDVESKGSQAMAGGVAMKPQQSAAIDDSGERQTAFNTVTISSDPPGSDVLVGGQLAGKTPVTLVTGKMGLPFTVTVQKPGYLIWTVQSISVSGNSKLHADLVPAR